MTATRDGKPIPSGAGEDAFATHALCDYAVGRLRAAGFRLVYTSMRSEACYYALPGREDVLRVAAHRFGRTEGRASSHRVSACLTFAPTHRPGSLHAVDGDVERAVGRYFMAPVPGGGGP